MKPGRERGKLNRRRIFREKKEPQGIIFGYQPKGDLKMNSNQRKTNTKRAGTLPSIAPNKKQENPYKSAEKASAHIIKTKTIKLNPLIFPEDLEHRPALFAIRHTKEELLFAMACRDAIKVYRLDPKTSYKSPPELILSKFNRRFINRPKFGPQKPPSEENRAHIPYLLLHPISFFGADEYEQFDLDSIFKIEDQEAKKLEVIFPQMLGSPSFDFDINFSNGDYRKTQLSIRKMTILEDQYLSTFRGIEHQYQVSNTENIEGKRKNREELAHFDGELSRIDLRALIKKKVRAQVKKKLGEIFSEQGFYLKYLRQDLLGSKDSLRGIDELKNRLMFTNNIHRYSELVLLAINFLGTIHIIIVNIKLSKIVKTMFINLCWNKNNKSVKPYMIDFAWNQEKDEAFASFVPEKVDRYWSHFELFSRYKSERSKICFKISNFSSGEKRQFHHVSTLKIKKGEHSQPVVVKKDENYTKALIQFIDPNTCLLKKSCLINSRFEGELLNLMDGKFLKITKSSIHEELIIDPENGLSVVRTHNKLYLYDRREDRVHWSLPYFYEFLDGTYSGKIIAKFDKSEQKLNLFGVCEEKNHFDLLKEIYLKDKRPSERCSEKDEKEDIPEREPFTAKNYEQNDLRMINFIYLEKKEEYLVAFVTGDASRKVTYDDMPIQYPRDFDAPFPVNLFLFKLKKSLEIVKVKGYKFNRDRDIHISVSENTIVALNSIHGPVYSKRGTYTAVYSYVLDFFDPESLEKIPISEDFPDNFFRFKFSTTGTIGPCGPDDTLSSFSFIEHDTIILEFKQAFYFYKNKVSITKKQRHYYSHLGGLTPKKRIFDGFENTHYFQLRLNSSSPENVFSSESDREQVDEDAENRKDESESGRVKSQRQSDHSLGSGGSRNPFVFPILKHSRRAKSKKAQKRRKNIAKFLINKYKNSFERNEPSRQGPRKKPLYKKSKKRKEIERDFEIKGVELISWEKKKAVLGDLRVFKAGEDPFFCILTPGKIQSKGDLILRHWDRDLIGGKTSKIEGYFKERKRSFKSKVKLSNLFYLTEGRVVIDECYGDSTPYSKYSFVLLNVKNNRYKEFKIKNRNLVPQRFLPWVSKKYGKSQKRKVIVADFDRLSNLVLMDFSSLF